MITDDVYCVYTLAATRPGAAIDLEGREGRHGFPPGPELS